MANVAYIRVSTVDQSEERQTEALKKYGIDKWFVDKASAKDTKRPQLQAMLDYIREGDTVFVHDFSRLARSTTDLLNIIENFKKQTIHFVSDKEKIDTSTATGKLMLTMIAAINEFERANLLERQREGIAIAKQKGKYKGRKKITIPDSDFAKHYERYMARETNKANLAKELHISRPTLDRLISQWKQKQHSH